MTQHYESLQAHREFLTKAHREAMSRLDVMEKAHDVISSLMADWRATKDGRNARIYVGDSALMVTLTLADGEIFGDAAETFDAALPAIRETFPTEWTGEWSEVRDDSDQREARRQTILHVAPPGGAWYMNGTSVWLTIAVPVTEGSACQIIQIGERREFISRTEERTVPVFKSVCPGDPTPLAAE